MATVVVKINTGEYGDAALLCVHLPADRIRWMLNTIDKAGRIASEEDTFFCIEFFDTSVQISQYSDQHPEEWQSLEGHLVVPDGTVFVKEDECRVECTTIVVTSSDVYWQGWERGSNIQWTSVGLTPADLYKLLQLHGQD